jgi:hypothetical protein
MLDAAKGGIMSGGHSHAGGGSGSHSHGGGGGPTPDFSLTPWFILAVGGLIGGHFFGIFVYQILNHGYAPLQSQMGPWAWFYTFLGFGTISGLATIIVIAMGVFSGTMRRQWTVSAILLAITLLMMIIAAILHSAGQSEKAVNPQTPYGSGKFFGQTIVAVVPNRTSTTPQ